MKKNNLILGALVLLGILILSAATGLCVEEIAQHVPAAVTQNAAQTAAQTTAPTELKATIIKFIITMIGVIASSLVIWGGLTVYNKFFVMKKENLLPKPEGEDLGTPKTVEDAVVFFIKRNKLK